MAFSTESQVTSDAADVGIAPVADPSTREGLARTLQRQTDTWLLAVCSLVVVGSMVLTPSSEAVTLLGWKLPPLCLYSALLGVECFGCGITRSFTYMGHGQLTEALTLHSLGPVAYVLVAAQVPLRAWRLWSSRHPIGADRS